MTNILPVLIATGVIGGHGGRSTSKTFTFSLTPEQTKQVRDALNAGMNVKINIEIK